VDDAGPRHSRVLSVQPRVRNRFVVPPTAIQADTIQFSSDTARQMRRVLRLGVGDRVAAFDGHGTDYVVRLLTLRDDVAVGAIEASSQSRPEPRLRLTLCQALLPREKFELVLQKGTEIGVSEFVPLETGRSLVKASAVDDGRLRRWQRIVEEAAEQAGRGVVPKVHEPCSLARACAALGNGPGLLAWEHETMRSLRSALRELEPGLTAQRLTLFVGPEGGFAETEVEQIRVQGVVTASLGPRILRAETAGPILAALALYTFGDLEPVG
jgi:16S rRNA (uracil1498-N3)-methyltransferase